jgi:hypothetical protein
MTQQLSRGVRLSCADVDYAAAQGMIEPVEIRWLSAAGVKCPNEQYEVMLALGTKGQLACADIEWNALNGLVNWNQAAGLLWRVPGCQLTKYAFLVTLAAQGGVDCPDIDWHQNVGLISPAQAVWLKTSLGAQGKFCYFPGVGTRTNPLPKGWPLAVNDDWTIRVTSWEPDVTAQAMGYNRFNPAPPPGYVYARLNVTATYNGTGSSNPYIFINVVDIWSNTYQKTYDISSGSGGDAHQLYGQPAAIPGGSVSGSIYYALPVGSAANTILGFAPYVTYSDVPGGVAFFRVN